MFVLINLKSYIIIKNKRRPKYDEYKINNIPLGIQNKKEISTLCCTTPFYKMDIRRESRPSSNLTLMHGFETIHVIMKNDHFYQSYYFSMDLKTLIHCNITCYGKLECKKLEYSILRDDTVRIRITREWAEFAKRYIDCAQHINYVYKLGWLQSVDVKNYMTDVHSDVRLYYTNGRLDSIYITCNNRDTRYKLR
jgi:hypothetical protein